MITTRLVFAGTALGLAVVGFLISLRWLVQPLLRVLLALRYRLVVVGREHIPRTGPVLIAANHVTWLDGFFLAGGLPPARTRAGQRRLHRLADPRPLGPLDRPDPRAVLRPEGPARHDPDVPQGARRGRSAGHLPRGADVPQRPDRPVPPRARGDPRRERRGPVVVPAFLDNLWGSLFSFSGGRFFWQTAARAAADGGRRRSARPCRRRSRPSPSARPFSRRA